MSVAGTTWSRSGTRRRGSGSERRAACQAKWRSSRCRGWTKDRRISCECVPRTIRAAGQRWRRRLKPRPRTRSVISTPRVFYLSPSLLRCRACVGVVYWRSVITGITCQEVKNPFGCTFFTTFGFRLLSCSTYLQCICKYWLMFCCRRIKFIK